MNNKFISLKEAETFCSGHSGTKATGTSLVTLLQSWLQLAIIDGTEKKNSVFLIDSKTPVKELLGFFFSNVNDIANAVSNKSKLLHLLTAFPQPYLTMKKAFTSLIFPQSKLEKLFKWDNESMAVIRLKLDQFLQESEQFQTPPSKSSFASPSKFYGASKKHKEDLHQLASDIFEKPQKGGKVPWEEKDPIAKLKLIEMLYSQGGLQPSLDHKRGTHSTTLRAMNEHLKVLHQQKQISVVPSISAICKAGIGPRGGGSYYRKSIWFRPISTKKILPKRHPYSALFSKLHSSFRDLAWFGQTDEFVNKYKSHVFTKVCMDDLGDVELNSMLWNKRHMVIASNPALVPMLDVEHGKRLQVSSLLFYFKKSISNLERLGISPTNKKRKPLLRYSSQIPLSIRVNQEQMKNINLMEQSVSDFMNLLRNAKQNILNWNIDQLGVFCNSIDEKCTELRLALPFNTNFTFVLQVLWDILFFILFPSTIHIDLIFAFPQKKRLLQILFNKSMAGLLHQSGSETLKHSSKCLEWLLRNMTWICPKEAID